MLTQGCLFFTLGNHRPVINASDFSDVKSETLCLFTGGICVVRVQGHLFLFSWRHFELKMDVHRAAFRASVAVKEKKRKPCARVLLHYRDLQFGPSTSARHSQWFRASLWAGQPFPTAVSDCCGTVMTFPKAFLTAPQSGLCGGCKTRGLRIIDCGQMSCHSLVQCGREGGRRWQNHFYCS